MTLKALATGINNLISLRSVVGKNISLILSYWIAVKVKSIRQNAMINHLRPDTGKRKQEDKKCAVRLKYVKVTLMDVVWPCLPSLPLSPPISSTLLSLCRSCSPERPRTENTIPLPTALCCRDRGRPIVWWRCTRTYRERKPQSLICKIKWFS